MSTGLITESQINMTKLTIIGLGVIGGSIAAAIKKYHPSCAVIGCDKNSRTLEIALKMKLINQGVEDIKEAIFSSDIILIATSISGLKVVLSTLAPHIKRDQIITDVCSVKSSVIDTARKILKEHFSQFVPGHPLAGSEKIGIEGIDENLFINKKIVLTPCKETDDTAVKKVTGLWQSLQAQVSIMDPEAHDKILSLTSHLPHVLAFSYLNALSKLDHANDILKYTSGSFNDVARIGKSSSNIWTDIFLANRDNLISSIELLEKQLIQLRNAIKHHDEPLIAKLIQSANALLKEYQND